MVDRIDVGTDNVLFLFLFECSSLSDDDDDDVLIIGSDFALFNSIKFDLSFNISEWTNKQKESVSPRFLGGLRNR